MTTEPLKVLLIEDDEDDYVLARDLLYEMDHRAVEIQPEPRDDLLRPGEAPGHPGRRLDLPNLTCVGADSAGLDCVRRRRVPVWPFLRRSLSDAGKHDRSQREHEHTNLPDLRTPDSPPY